MRKRLISVFLAAMVIISLVPAAVAADNTKQYTADALRSLDLFLGTDQGYQLDANLSREHGVVLLLRMFGVIDKAEKYTGTHPFDDVTVTFYDNYIAYAYAQKLTQGTGEHTFGFTRAMNERMFLTIVLRALGYDESRDDIWNHAFELGVKAGIIADDTPIESFRRGDAVIIFWNALEAKLADGSKTLAEKLIAEGCFTEEEYQKAIAIQKNEPIDETPVDPTPVDPAPIDPTPVDPTPPAPTCTHPNMTVEVTKTPTAFENGERVFTCHDCLYTYTEVIPMNPAYLKWEEYQAMSGTERDAFFARFERVTDFIAWMSVAQKAYEEGRELIEIDAGGEIVIIP